MKPTRSPSSVGQGPVSHTSRQLCLFTPPAAPTQQPGHRWRWAGLLPHARRRATLFTCDLCPAQKIVARCHGTDETTYRDERDEFHPSDEPPCLALTTSAKRYRSRG